MSSRYAAPTSLSAPRYSCLSTMYQVRRTMCSGLPLACARTSRMFCSAWRNWPAKELSRHSPCPVQPTCPAMKTRRPRVAMPLEKPFALAQPGGCRICITPILLTSQLEALQLARLGARQRFHKLDGPRVLVGRYGLLHVLLELAHGSLPDRKSVV